ncbi:MAG: single-stranded DNA-binding protein [Bacteroidota bacterium]
MSSLNKVMLIGRLGRDPEVRYLENGAAVAKFSIATSESYKDKSGNWQEQTEWHDIIMWRVLAERAEQQLSKGKLIYVEGKLTHRKWEDKDGNPRKTTEVVAQTFRMLEKREANPNSGYFPSTSDEMGNKNAVEKPAPVVDNAASKEEPSDDLPF